MTDATQPARPSPAPEANAHFQRGLDLKSKGQFDAALTEFRRAVIVDGDFFAAQMEVGYMCREKAKLEKIFLRHAFEAFRHAARLDLTSEDAHNQYIMAGQQMGQLDDLLREYEAWSKAHPENEMLHRCHKNIIAISMAMMPASVSVGNRGSSGLRRLLLLGGILGVLGGLVIALVVPLVMSKTAPKSNPGTFVKTGLALMAASFAAIVASSRFR